jgi:mRNA interferase MazF
MSRDAFIRAPYSTVVAIPVYTSASGVRTEVPVGPEEGLAHASVLRCDEITSVQKGRLTDFVGTLSESRMGEVSDAIKLALALVSSDL